MRSKLFLSTLAVAATVVATANIYSNQATDTRIPALNPKATSDSGVAAPVGGFWSEVENDAGNTTVSNTTGGYSCRENGVGAGFFRLADDVVVSNGQMVITGFKGYAYRSGATFTLLTGGNVNILDSDPSLGTPNILGTGTGTSAVAQIPVNANGATVVTGNVFRCFNTQVPAPGTAPGTTRQIQEVAIPLNAATTLGPGTYWVDFQLNQEATPVAPFAFAPSTTHEESRSAPNPGNSYQKTSATGWVPLEDTGNPATPPNVRQECVFVLTGHVIRWDEQYNIVSGQFFGGDLDSLKADDGNILYVLCDESGPVSDIRVGFKTTISWTSSMVLRVISGSDRTDQFERISLEQNPVGSGNWVPFDLSATTAADTEKNIVINNPANFIGPDGQVRVRVRVDPAEDLIAVDGWSNRYGLMNLRCNP